MSNKKRKAFGVIPQDVSQNLQAPETAPSDKRITGRTKQLNFKVKEEFYWKLKNLAVEEKCMMVEILEKSLGSYGQEKQIQADKEVIKRKSKNKPQQKLTPYSYLNFTCDKCGDEYEQDTAYSYALSLNEINDYPTYCADCVNIIK